MARSEVLILAFNRFKLIVMLADMLQRRSHTPGNSWRPQHDNSFKNRDFLCDQAVAVLRVITMHHDGDEMETLCSQSATDWGQVGNHMQCVYMLIKCDVC